MAGSRLDTEHVARFRADHSTGPRADMVVRVANQARRDGISAEARRLALAILEDFASDAEVVVRETLARQFRDDDRLPPTLALRLAMDVAAVAAPVLQGYPGFADEALLEVIGGGDPAKLRAIADRRRVSGTVAAAIIDSDDVEAVARLAINPGADLTVPLLDRIIDEHGQSERVLNATARRHGLPAAVAWRLLTRVSEAVAQELGKRHRIPPPILRRFQERGSDASFMLLIRPLIVDAEQLRDFMEQLRYEKRLTAGLLFRALCAGDLDVFSTGFAVLSGVSETAAAAMLRDRRPRALEEAFRRAGLQLWLVEPFRAVLAIAVGRGWRIPEPARRAFQVEAMACVFDRFGGDPEPDVADLIAQMLDGKAARDIEEALR